jgi:hypothetical protein
MGRFSPTGGGCDPRRRGRRIHGLDGNRWCSHKSGQSGPDSVDQDRWGQPRGSGPASRWPAARSRFGDRVVFTEEKGDSTLLRLSSEIVKNHHLGGEQRGEIVWSHDRTMLAIADDQATSGSSGRPRQRTGPLPPPVKLPATTPEPFWL